ncbi:MAG: hypothetical protein Q9222_000755 [Ikaeria aurantiellina]
MNRQRSQSSGSATLKPLEQEDGEENKAYDGQRSPNPRDESETMGANENDGLAACPICAKRMKEEAVFSHLDTHNDTPEASEKVSLRSRRSPSIEILGRSNNKRKPPERLPQLNYSLMKESALRKKLAELGITNTGPRNLLIRRHAEWVNIVNANADSSKPKTKREMIRELEVWDRSTGRSIANGNLDSSPAGSIMDKDFDGATWSLNHSSDYRDLISRARHAGKAANGSASSHSPPKPRPEEKLHGSPISGDLQPLSESLQTQPIDRIRNSADPIVPDHT